MSMVFSAMIEMTRHVHHVFDEISLESRPLIFVYLYTRTQFSQFRNKSSNSMQK